MSIQLVSHVIPEHVRIAAGLGRGFVRMSIGIEDVKTFGAISQQRYLRFDQGNSSICPADLRKISRRDL